MTLYSQKKKDKLYWFIAIAILCLAYACGPSKEEIEARDKLYYETELEYGHKSNHTTLTKGCCGEEFTVLNYYDSSGHEYIGRLGNTANANYITHSGQCPKCRHKDSLMMVTILKNFFELKH